MPTAYYGIMKLELKTESDQLSKPFISGVVILVIIAFVIILSNISIKLGIISKHYEINYLCKILVVEKSSFNFKKLSKLSKQTSKQKIWDMCKEIIKY